MKGPPRENKPLTQAPMTGHSVGCLQLTGGSGRANPELDTVPRAVTTLLGGAAPPSFTLFCTDFSSQLLGLAHEGHSLQLGLSEVDPRS